ncbi:MAG: UpxY family transcription antiterminator [Muribaculaceae bacterium]|nr:UpxY family transcription antiterminator [Muribaculaceae bacterium]
MRDLKRANANIKAWQILTEAGFEVFTPMHWKIYDKNGRKVRKYVPVISDLLFVHTQRDKLDPIVKKTETLQYRFSKNSHSVPMTVSEAEMNKFIRAIENSESVRYYKPEEITSSFKGRKIRIVGGSLNGYEGKLLTTRGSKVKRLMIEIPNLLHAGIEVHPDFIQFID